MTPFISTTPSLPPNRGWGPERPSKRKSKAKAATIRTVIPIAAARVRLGMAAAKAYLEASSSSSPSASASFWASPDFKSSPRLLVAAWAEFMYSL